MQEEPPGQAPFWAHWQTDCWPRAQVGAEASWQQPPWEVQP